MLAAVALSSSSFHLSRRSHWSSPNKVGCSSLRTASPSVTSLKPSCIDSIENTSSLRDRADLNNLGNLLAARICASYPSIQVSHELRFFLGVRQSPTADTIRAPTR